MDDQNIHALKDTIVSLSSLIAIVNERITGAVNEIERLTSSANDGHKQHNEILTLSQSLLHQIQLFAQSLEQHRKDADRIGVDAIKAAESVGTYQQQIKEKIADVMVELKDIASRINSAKSDIEHIRSNTEELKNSVAKPESKQAGDDKTSLKAKIIIALISSTAAWKLIELFINFVKQGASK